MIRRILILVVCIALSALSDGCRAYPPRPTSSPQPSAAGAPTLIPTLTSVPLAAIEVPPRDPTALIARLKGITEPISPACAPVPDHLCPPAPDQARAIRRGQVRAYRTVVNTAPPSYELGDQEAFWVGNADTSEHYRITATLRAMTPHLYMWVEGGSRVDQAALDRSARRFEERTYPTDRALFGSEWTLGVDNDIHLSILNAHRLGSGIAGYYSSADEFPHLINPFSNEREVFYVNLDILQPGTEDYDRTLAHEFQHMIHWANDCNEDAWVNEGFSTLAEYLNGYDPGYYVRSYLHTPDTQLTAWALTDQPTLPHYGASFLFTLYFLERFGEEEAGQVVAEQANGSAGFEAPLGPQHISFEDIFSDWAVATYLDRVEMRGGRYGYEGLDPPTPQLSAEEEAYPIQRRATVHQYGVDYILLEGEGDLRVSFQGAPQVRVVPNEPHSGRYQWWSNYGDESDMTLTRAFDLSELEEATLEVWLWYDIEEGWDYAYVEVSTDGGESWQILEGEHTTDYNPNGNAFGSGYTGRSGGAQEGSWVQERVDLSPYAGQDILLRFEYITDDAVNHPGLCVDDIAIPELGYQDDVEEGSGWEAIGFARTDNRLHQRFAVLLIELTDPPRVRRVQLDEEQKGEIVVKGLGQEMEKAVLTVSGLTPVTMETATYTYTVESLSEAD